MLYLPPLWGHDGVADGECMTCSVGFRSPDALGLSAELLQRLADGDDERGTLYRDPKQPATANPGQVPPALAEFARTALTRRLAEPGALERALGEALSEPKSIVWFDAAPGTEPDAGVHLDRRSRMLYDEHHVFLNGESFRVAGRDGRLMRRLADERQLPARDVAALSEQALDVVRQWLDDGWLRAGVNP